MKTITKDNNNNVTFTFTIRVVTPHENYDLIGPLDNQYFKEIFDKTGKLKNLRIGKIFLRENNDYKGHHIIFYVDEHAYLNQWTKEQSETVEDYIFPDPPQSFSSFTHLFDVHNYVH